MKFAILILFLIIRIDYLFSENKIENNKQCSEVEVGRLNSDKNSMSSDMISNANSSKSIYWAIKTNALYDAVLIPNIGAEIAFKDHWSASANWMYAWWHNDRKHNYWRTYGGDLELRYWLGKKAEAKPLQGHHVGVYGQLLTYDFEFGGRGYLGDKWSYAAGVSYGYSLPIAKRLNLDFNLGIGYLGGKYKEYVPDKGCYVWLSTKKRRWFGPTKLEISLVWLLGRDNFNKKKGAGL